MSECRRHNWWREMDCPECGELDDRDKRISALEAALAEAQYRNRILEQQLHAAGLIVAAQDGPPSNSYTRDEYMELLEKDVAEAQRANEHWHTRVNQLLTENAAYADKLAEAQRERDELVEPMPCGHYGANLQPTDGPGEACIVCAEMTALHDRLAVCVEALEAYRNYKYSKYPEVIHHTWDEVDRLLMAALDAEEGK